MTESDGKELIKPGFKFSPRSMTHDEVALLHYSHTVLELPLTKVGIPMI